MNHIMNLVRFLILFPSLCNFISIINIDNPKMIPMRSIMKGASNCMRMKGEFFV